MGNTKNFINSSIEKRESKFVDTSLGNYTLVLGDEKKQIFFYGEQEISIVFPAENTFDYNSSFQLLNISTGSDILINPPATIGGFSQRLVPSYCAVLSYVFAETEPSWSCSYRVGGNLSVGIDNNFANDAAAAVGGISVGELYHNSGAVRIRLT